MKIHKRTACYVSTYPVFKKTVSNSLHHPIPLSASAGGWMTESRSVRAWVTLCNVTGVDVMRPLRQMRATMLLCALPIPQKIGTKYVKGSGRSLRK